MFSMLQSQAFIHVQRDGRPIDWITIGDLETTIWKLRFGNYGWETNISASVTAFPRFGNYDSETTNPRFGNQISAI